jgi:hypothetical protein
MVMRHDLTAVHPVVLKREYSQRLVSCEQRASDLTRGFDDRCPFLVRELQQRCHMAPSDHTALTDLELIRVDDR